MELSRRVAEVIWLVAGGAVILAVLGMPVAFALGLTTLLGFAQLGDPTLYLLIPQRMFAGMDSFVLIAIPLFILAGEIMNKTGITMGLVNASNAVVGHVRGGLAHVTVLTEIIVSGITGSAIADVAVTGSIMIPAMEKEGYDKRFAAAVVAASSLIGPIIPPSIPMIIYASIQEVSVAGLFAAGMLPGILLGVFFMILSWHLCVRRRYSTVREWAGVAHVLSSVGRAIPSLVMPVIILGGIVGGVTTPTEAAAVAVLYGLMLGFLVLRTLRVADLPEMLGRTVITTSVILFILGGATLFGWMLSYLRIPQTIAVALLSISQNPYVLLALVNIFLLICGMFLDLTLSMVLFAPIFAPVLIGLGIHPLHFAIVFTVNLTIGLVTPPYGLVLFAVSSLSGVSVEEAGRFVFPFIVVSIGFLFLITFVPAIPMAVPRALGWY